MSYVYKKTNGGLYTVGFHDPDGKWHPESDHDAPEKAAERTHYLNGGAKQEQRRLVTCYVLWNIGKWQITILGFPLGDLPQRTRIGDGIGNEAEFELLTTANGVTVYREESP